MSKQFLKSGEIQLVNGGYLSNKDEKPVFNSDFVVAQEHAHYIMTFAKLAKGKDFEGKEVDSLDDLKKEVAAALADEAPEYVKAPKEVKRPTTDKLAEEALAFVKYNEDKSKAEKVNAFLQQFNILKEFEDFGLFFEEDIVKLKKIYTLKEVVSAVEETIDLLD